MKHTTIILLSLLVAVPAFADDTTDARLQRELRSTEKSSFEHSWNQRRGAVRVGVGDYEVLGGDAEKPMEDCMRAFEGSSTPPSCLSGFTAQRKAPATAPSE